MSAFQRAYVSEVRRCQDLERRIRYITNEMKKDSIELMVLEEEDEPAAPLPKDIINLEAKLESIEFELRELSQNAINLNENFLEMTELRQVLEKTSIFLAETPIDSSIHLMNERDTDINSSDDQHQQSNTNTHLSFVTGVIQLEKYFAFEKILWRISRGNIFLKRSDLPRNVKDPVTGDVTTKTVFIAFFQGEELKQRIKKVCSGFQASIYPCPNGEAERSAMILDVKRRLEELQLVLNTTSDHRSRVLMAATRNIPLWSIMVKKMKAIFHCMNMFSMDVSSKCMIGECWVPNRDLFILQSALNVGSAMGESAIPSFLNVLNTNEPPPTFHRTNKFTQGFQNLIDSYGIASYREMNPALYTCITFPFLFAVMFGDLGHGLLLFLFALALILNERRFKHIKGEIFNIFFGGRYIILLMGLFSLYTGLIYNDIFSKSMNLFGSSWSVQVNTNNYKEFHSHLQLNPTNESYGVYAVGIDPIWQLAENKIIFLNTYKMKLSIIFGVLHMVFGVCLSLMNSIYQRKYINIMLEFMPQIVFMLLLFGYMVFMMFLKWILYSAKTDDITRSPYCAPSILILFINMMLQKHQIPPLDCQEYMFNGQEQLQNIFVIVALVCIPWMLFGKPIYFLCKSRRKDRQKSSERKTSSMPLAAINSSSEQSQTSSDAIIEITTNSSHVNPAQSTEPTAAKSTASSHEDESIAEICIHQAIHTIEYVLSTVSHTASYLRLWALSLAHARKHLPTPLLL